MSTLISRLKNGAQSRPAVVALVAAVALPTLVTATAVVSLGDRADAARELRAAVVNLDEPVTSKESGTVAAGRLLAAGLTRPAEGDPDPGMDWVLADPDSAADGLADGTFHAVVTVPADFSATIAKISTDAPQQAGVEVRTDGADATVVGTITTDVSQVAADSLGRTVTTSYLNQLFEGTNTLGGKLSDAADGAAELTDGAGKLSDGLGTLRTGSASLADGAKKLDSGAGTLSKGTRDAATGATRLDSGSTQLADGANQLSSGISDLSTGATRLRDGSSALADGARSVDDGATRLADGLGQLDAATVGLEKQSTALADGAAQVSDGVAGYAKVLQGWGQACANPLLSGSVPELCAATSAALGADGANATALVDGAAQLATGTRTLADSAPQIRSGITAAHDGADALAAGTGELSSGADDLASGAATLASGAKDADAAAAQLASGAGELSTGASSLAAGTSRLAAGSKELTSGTGDLVSGSTRLADGAKSADAGSTKLASGAGELATGLRDGADQVPVTDEVTIRTKAETVAQPVVARAVDDAPSGGRAQAAPSVVATALWLGALGIFLTVPAVQVRRLSRATTARRTVARALAPALALGVAQVALVLGAVHLLDLDLARPWLLALVAAPAAALAALTVTQAVVALCGERLGGVLVVALTVVQALTLPGFLPLDAAPGWLQSLNGLLPVPLATDAVAWTVTGAGSGASVAGLLLWSLAAVVVSVWATARRGTTTLATIRRQVAAPA
ncbi:YhgE/Pip domain-containing protein [Nocardioides yefusunii]|uniref:YhgE/Pip domain-containing protein n=1 Tax=Nocardioides yefusunii TaxID=2500546 RepID=A0ABW1QWA4_9ACTN|nr:YhgE/Pip domain-containing protein [Nocardioides yefusunii]